VVLQAQLRFRREVLNRGRRIVFVSLQRVRLCIGEIVAVKNSFGHAHISGADEFAPPERAKIELLSRIEGRFRVKDEAMARTKMS
jgi:hypothetical protein